MGRSLSRRPPKGLVFGASFDHGDARDLSTTNATPTLQGNAVVTGTELDLDGTGDWCEYPDHASYSFTDGAGNDKPFSCAFWTKQVDASTFYSGKGWSNGEWTFGTGSTDLIAFLIGDGTAFKLRRSNAGIGYLQGTYTHLACTYDGSNTGAGMKIYLNGTVPPNNLYESPPPDDVYTGMADNTYPLRIGSLDGSTSGNGLISDFQIFDYELTATEVAILRQKGPR